MVDRNKTQSIKGDLEEIKPYLNDINNFKKSDTRKIDLIIAINYVFSKDTDEEHEMHSKGNTNQKQKLPKNFWNHFLIDIKLGWRHQ